MTSGKTVSYKAIIDKLLRDFPFDEKVNVESCIEWLAEFMCHTNVGIMMQNKIEFIAVIDGRGPLPSDLYRIRQCAELSGAKSMDDAKCGKGKLVPMRWSTDNFHLRYHSDNRDYTTQSSSTYTVAQNFIFSSFGTGIIAISYDAFPTDDEGFPLIPADQQWMEASTHYLAHRISRRMWLNNEMPADKYHEIERDKEHYFAQAVNHAKQLNGVDDAESFKNQMVRTIPSMQDHSNFFANMQVPEMRYFRPKIGTVIGNALGSVPTVTSPIGVPGATVTGQQQYLPISSVDSIGSITSNSANVFSNVSSIGNFPILDHGLVYSTLSSPTVDNSILSLGTLNAPEHFVGSLIGLNPTTTYYVRPFTRVSNGVTYGTEKSFTTL